MTSKKIPQKLIEAWRKRFEKTGVPDCMSCGTPMEMGYDSTLKKKSKHIWVFKCKCHKEGMQLMMLQK